MAFFKGYSTVSGRKQTLTDQDLVKQDLLNHLNTRLGERLMYPRFGTSIYDLIHDPLDSITEETILTEMQNIVKFDPRLKLDRLRVNSYEHGIQVEMDVTYININISERLIAEFDNRTNTAELFTVPQ